ncbi:MAG: glycosyltransferase family 4 protein [Raineya sp.]|jgi:glycosyltransferase involved in cell wall biosynthesis|nr:glycosyltransferase family 4 protein [Raineya sp.]
MKITQRIFAFHLLNDYSGSPKVLMQLLKTWGAYGYSVHLYTSQNKGFLSDINHVIYHQGWYKYSSNRWLRLFLYTLSQMWLVIKMFRTVKKTDIVYVNTILPFGAAILGKLKGCKVIYHIHEVSIKPRILKWFLLKMIKIFADRVVYVSQYVADNYDLNDKRGAILYNSIENHFLDVAEKNRDKKQKQNHVLMVCSLKAYKGIFEFIQLAKDNPEYQFRLVLNAHQTEIKQFFKDKDVPLNVHIFDTQKNMHPFYLWADIILNLSKPDGWIETFGLTIIEGMAYGLPAIVPTIGGITEVIEEGKTGFMVDSQDTTMLNRVLQSVLDNPLYYKTLSENSKKRIESFSEDLFAQKSIQILN